MDDVRVRGIGRSAAAEDRQVEKAEGHPAPEKVTPPLTFSLPLACWCFEWVGLCMFVCVCVCVCACTCVFNTDKPAR